MFVTLAFGQLEVSLARGLKAHRPSLSWRPTMIRLLGFVAAVLTALAATGCATSGTTLTRPDRGGEHVIYRISEEQAFTTALAAYAALFPKQSVDDIVHGQRRGYNADERSWMDWWSHRLLVIPAVGTDASGNRSMDIGTTTPAAGRCLLPKGGELGLSS